MHKSPKVKCFGLCTSQPSERGGLPTLWLFPITPNPTSLNLSSYTGLGYEQEPAFSGAVTTIHDIQTVFKLNNSFAVPHSLPKSFYFSKRSRIFVAGFSRKIQK